MNVNVNIERLILRGVALTPTQRHILHGTVKSELSRLLSEETPRDDTFQNQHVNRVSAGQIQLEAQANPQKLGSQIAAAIYGGIGQRR